MDHAIQERSWLHPAIEVRDSPIHGRGLFTTEDLQQGLLAVEFGGVEITDHDLDSLIPAHRRIDLGRGKHLLIQADDPARFANHSCDPNLWIDGQTRLVTRREVRAGEELTADYATYMSEPEWRFMCTCASATCRVLVTSRDLDQGDLRGRYADHWGPQLLQHRDRPNEW